MIPIAAVLSFTAAVTAAPAASAASDPQISGDYLEFRTADVFTGPCFANAEVGLTGTEAAMAWHIRGGQWQGVALDDLTVVAVVLASSTLGDPYADPLPAKAVVVVDARATPEQRAALVEFARAQSRGLLGNIVAVEAMPMRFAETGHGSVSLAVGEDGRQIAISTRPFHEGDHICRNETAYYEPLAANLIHAMPVMTLEGAYRGGHLGKTWREAGRRGSYVGSFAARESPRVE